MIKKFPLTISSCILHFNILQIRLHYSMWTLALATSCSAVICSTQYDSASISWCAVLVFIVLHISHHPFCSTVDNQHVLKKTSEMWCWTNPMLKGPGGMMDSESMYMGNINAQQHKYQPIICCYEHNQLNYDLPCAVSHVQDIFIWACLEKMGKVSNAILSPHSPSPIQIVYCRRTLLAQSRHISNIPHTI